MKKFCVFCGNEPENKNKEHIIPQWLIKMTGDSNRIAYWGFDYQDIFDEDKVSVNPRKYTFLNFTFPACEKCNSEYGDILEGQAKGVIEQILNEETLTEDELIILLDWFDKIRVGMWLGYIYYNKNMEIQPKFHISSRIRKTDRALFVYKTQDNSLGLNFFGPGTPLYTNNPVYFGMRINNYVFLNISKDNLLLSALGFPYPKTIKINHKGNYEMSDFQNGTGRITLDFLSDLKILNTDVIVLQPIYEKFLSVDEFGNDYVKQNSADTQIGMGNVFIYNKGMLGKMAQEKYSLNPRGVYMYLKPLLEKMSIKVSKLMINYAKKIIDMLENEDDMENEIQELQMGIQYEELIMKKRAEMFQSV